MASRRSIQLHCFHGDTPRGCTSRSPSRIPPSMPGASPPDVLYDSRGCWHPLRNSGCRVTPQPILISSSTTFSRRLAVPLFSLLVPRIISEDDGAPRTEAVQQAERTPPCPLGGSAPRRPPDVSRNRPIPRAAVSLPSWVRSWSARPDQVSCPHPPPRTDGRCHIVACADGNPPIVPRGAAQRSFGRVSAHAFAVFETMWPTK